MVRGLRKVIAAATPAVVLCACLLLSGDAERAGGAFPGKNGLIAFSRIARAPSGNGFRDTIYTVTKRGRHRRAVTTGCCIDDDPAYSPNGKRIAFDRDGHIFTMRADGSRLHKLTKGKRFHGKPFEDSGPSWSPHGGRLVFWRRYQTSRIPSDLFTIRADGSKLNELKTKDLDELEPIWSAKSRQIAFRAIPSLGGSTPQKRGIYVMRPNGTHVKLVLEVHGERDGLDWSPNGKALAFARRGDGGVEIFKVRADGSHETRLTHTSRPAFDPAFSPNGSRIVFTTHGSLHLVRIGGGKSTLLLGRSGRAVDVAPDWQPR
jgi:TolB protein